MSAFLNLMSWLTIVILPVVLLLYMQVAFLPYHDVTTTWINRIFLTLDIAGILLIGVFLMRAETSFFAGVLALDLRASAELHRRRRWYWRSSPISRSSPPPCRASRSTASGSG